MKYYLSSNTHLILGVSDRLNKGFSHCLSPHLEGRSLREPGAVQPNRIDTRSGVVRRGFITPLPSWTQLETHDVHLDRRAYIRHVLG